MLGDTSMILKHLSTKMKKIYHSDSEWDFWFVNFFVVNSCSEIGFLHTTRLLRHQGFQKIKKGQRNS